MTINTLKHEHKLRILISTDEQIVHSIENFCTEMSPKKTGLFELRIYSFFEWHINKIIVMLALCYGFKVFKQFNKLSYVAYLLYYL